MTNTGPLGRAAERDELEATSASLLRRLVFLSAEPPPHDSELELLGRRLLAPVSNGQALDLLDAVAELASLRHDGQDRSDRAGTLFVATTSQFAPGPVWRCQHSRCLDEALRLRSSRPLVPLDEVSRWNHVVTALLMADIAVTMLSLTLRRGWDAKGVSYDALASALFEPDTRDRAGPIVQPLRYLLAARDALGVPSDRRALAKAAGAHGGGEAIRKALERASSGAVQDVVLLLEGPAAPFDDLLALHAVVLARRLRLVDSAGFDGASFTGTAPHFVSGSQAAPEASSTPGVAPTQAETTTPGGALNSKPQKRRMGLAIAGLVCALLMILWPRPRVEWTAKGPKVELMLVRGDNQPCGVGERCVWIPKSQPLTFHYRRDSDSRFRFAYFVGVGPDGEPELLFPAPGTSAEIPTSIQDECSASGICPLGGGEFPDAAPGGATVYAVLSESSLDTELLLRWARNPKTSLPGTEVSKFELEVRK
ncbi:MAG: hypothetical protein HY791_33425 [Deltaproteobacteria bacterium]|nr:hypothetical protein [Deltaproteobacteria bacterium]